MRPLGTARSGVRRGRRSEATEFVAAAAHELRAPLTVVSGMATTLHEFYFRMSPDDVERGFEAISRQCDRMKSLVDDLLDLARLEAGHRPPLETVTIVRLVADAMEGAPPPDGVTLEIRESERNLTVRSNGESIVRVLVNLLTNAYKYGGAHVVVDIRALPKEVVLAVVDDGPGVPAGVVPTLFHPFSRGDNGREAGGTGLGLALSRQLAESLGGELSYDGGNSHGCEFALRLPRCAATQR